MSKFNCGVNRSALAPVPAAETGANAHRLISPTQTCNVDKACNVDKTLSGFELSVFVNSVGSSQLKIKLAECGNDHGGGRKPVGGYND